MRHTAFLFSIIAVLFISGAASAQEKEQSQTVSNDAFGVTAEVPEGWEKVEGNERAVFNFKEAESQSQIEVIGTRLMTADVAKVFFDTFHETLENSGFSQSSTEENAEIGEYTGKKSVYTFTNTGVTLQVPIFEFVADNVAWIVVGYIQEDVAEQYSGVFNKVIESIKLEQ